MDPWKELVPRPIPFLTEQTVYPVRVEELHHVKPISYAVHIDLRNHMVPGSEDHMNTVTFTGYLATVVETDRAATAVFGFTNTNLFGALSVNGVWYSREQFYGEDPERYLEIQLNQGNNLVIFDVTGADLAVGWYFAVDCSVPLRVVSPLDDARRNDSDSEFISIGPFEMSVNTTRPVDQMPVAQHPAFGEAGTAACLEDLEWFTSWILAVPAKFVDPDNVFTKCVWKRESLAAPVPRQLHNAVIAYRGAAIIPQREGYDTELIVDFGQILSGFLSFELEAPQGTIVDFYGFEYMRDGWRQHTYKMNNTIRYICKEGLQMYESLVRRGLRYVAITVRGGEAGAIRLHSVRMEQSLFPVADIGDFRCSDTLLTDIWRISRETVRLCMEDTFVDCPTYEQTFWVGDSRNEALVAYYVFGAEGITRHSLELVPGSGEQTPYYACQVPSGWSSVIPNWTFFWVIACWEYYEQTGEEDFVRRIWPHIRFTLDHYLECINEDGLFDFQGWNLLEWAQMDSPSKGVVTHQHLFLTLALRTAGMAAGLLGETEDQERFVAAASLLRDSANCHLWSEERGAYLDCIHADGRRSEVFSMQTQVVAHLCGAPDLAKGERIEALISAPPEDFVQIGSPFMSFFYYEALAEMKQMPSIVDDIRRNYRQMIDEDASACWEMFPNSTNRQNDKFLTRSHCHAWSAAPAYFLGAYVLGVRRVDIGWRKAIIAPQPCGLNWCRGAVPLPHAGRIEVSWRLDEDASTFHLQVWAPKDVELDIRIPDGYEGVIIQHRI
jgi:hypothetical protein